MLSEEQILGIVRKTTFDSFDNDIENIRSNSKSYTYPILIGRLDRYVKKLSHDSNIPVQSEIDELQRDLYDIIREVFAYRYDNKYRIAMTILHLYFYQYRDTVLNEREVNRFSISKFVDEKHQNTFKTYIKILTMLCDASTSRLNIANAILPKLLDRNIIYSTDLIISNIYKYYKGI